MQLFLVHVTPLVFLTFGLLCAQFACLESLNPEEENIRRLLEAEFLKALGLTSMPKPVGPKAHVHEYMIEVYNKSAGLAPIDYSNPFDVAASQAHTIRSTYHMEDKPQLCFDVNCMHATILKFNISQMHGNNLSAAELRIYHDPGIEDVPKSVSFIKIVTLEEIVGVADPNGNLGSTQPIDSRMISNNNADWLAFDVGNLVRKWSEDHQTNHGFLIKVKSGNPENIQQGRPNFGNNTHHDSHVLHSRRSRRSKQLPFMSKRPLLVTYHGPKLRIVKSQNRKRRDTNVSNVNGVDSKLIDNEVEEKLKRDENYNDGEVPIVEESEIDLSALSQNKGNLWDPNEAYANNIPKDTENIDGSNKASDFYGKVSMRAKEDEGNCKPYSFQVNFKNLGWGELILHPKMVDLLQCRGHCTGIRASFINTTNHAMIQNLFHTAFPREVPSACCSPVEFEDMYFLTYDDMDVLGIRRMPYMKLKACGCR